MSAESSTPREAPWLAGVRAARANAVPGLLVQGVMLALLVQGVMLALLLAYFFYPPTTLWLDRLAEVKARWGYGYSALSAIVAGAFLPELIGVAVFQKGKFRRANLANLRFTIPFWALMGTVVDGFYRMQAGWFGDEASFAVVLKKVLIDQFVYNPLFAAPFTAALYDWKNGGYGLRGLGRFFTARYYRDAVVPTLCATWGVWIPLVAIIYSLPSPLQIPMFGLALCLWVILYTWMSERRSAACQRA